MCVCVCERVAWKSVLPESLSAIFLGTFLFVSSSLPFKEVIPLFEARLVPEFQFLCVRREKRMKVDQHTRQTHQSCL